jgi:gliding motility-associated-like protein
MTDLQPNLVQVSSIPVPGFVIEPQTVDILSPQVTVTSNAMDAVSCYYQTSDGGQSFACDFQYDFTQAGIQTITQVVTNEFGCSRSVTGEVNVTGFLLYIPNSFTPDHDGINDVWIPEGTGITAYELSIYNRWGDKIFYSTDPQKAWTGDVHGGEYFAEDGVYNYWLIVQDLMGFPHEYKGTIGLMR